MGRHGVALSALVSVCFAAGFTVAGGARPARIIVKRLYAVGGADVSGLPMFVDGVRTLEPDREIAELLNGEEGSMHVVAAQFEVNEIPRAVRAHGDRRYAIHLCRLA